MHPPAGATDDTARGDNRGSRGRVAASVCERSRDDLARRLVGPDHAAGRRDLAVDELQPRWDRAVREQALARPDAAREDPTAERVDAVGAQARPGQLSA